MVRLVPMESADFARYLEALVGTYAEDNIRVGRWNAQEGLAEAWKEVQGFLPAGRETPNHFFFTINGGEPEERVGACWLAIELPTAFVYDILVFEPFRRRGYAEHAMLLLERAAREKGAEKLSLQVFGDNQGARKLYAKLGYAETNVWMSKPLAPRS